MKAKEYFEKYDRIIIDEQIAGSIESTKKLLFELCDEVKDICEKRKAKKNSAVVAVLLEIDQKWNAICSLYEKKYGVSPLNRGAFMEFWKLQIPQIQHELERRKLK